MHTFTDLDNNSVKFVFVFPRFYLELIYTTEQFLQINYVKVIIKLRHVTEIESIILGGNLIDIMRVFYEIWIPKYLVKIAVYFKNKTDIVAVYASRSQDSEL